jgi:glycerol-3-phosphate O-acyltransferase
MKTLVDGVWDGAFDDIHLVPVTVMIGRAPDKETRIAKIFFTESWEIGGRIRRFLGMLVNGRDTLVQFSTPVSLREMAAEMQAAGLEGNRGAERCLRKVSRLIRVHFRQVRIATIGPDLSHRRTVVEQILQSPAIRAAIADKAARDGISEDKATKIARGYAFEIAANYSYQFVRIVSFPFTWFWNRIYDGVELNHFNEFRRSVAGHEVIYVPCHRSHIDYLLVSFFLYHNGLVPPHIAAGLNMNLPVLGAFLRMGGAFYLRRSFKAQKLYSAVFNAYLSRILSEGTAIEYFVEGTRSRTGRLLPPKGGMLSMTVRGFLRAPSRPVVFQPIYVGYERLVEGRSYTAELSGQKKKAESWGDLLRSWKILRQRYGKVHVSFGEAIYLNDMLDRFDPAWRDTTADESARPQWLPSLIDELGRRIMSGINEATHVNAVNLLATTLLATPKQSLGRDELQDQLALYVDLLNERPYAARLTVTDRTPAQMIEYGQELGIVEVREHPLGEIITLTAERAVLQTYFRNNVSHLFALPSLIAGCFMNEPSIDRETLLRIVTSIYPFLRAELFLKWPPEALEGAVEELTGWFAANDLLTLQPDGVIRRARGSSAENFRLRLLGRASLQSYERYYITIAVLAKNGSGVLTRPDLERLCTLTAQRISLLTEFEAPEFHDPNLFRQFISLLKDLKILSVNDDGRLEFNSMIEQISDDAKRILSKEARHSIVRVAPQVLRDGTDSAEEAKTPPLDDVEHDSPPKPL